MELISKDEAKRKITEELDSIDHVPSWVYERLSTAIEFTPTVEERKEGRWETVNFKTIPTDRISKAKKCSECGKRKDKYVAWNYCPNCGAYMKGE